MTKRKLPKVKKPARDGIALVDIEVFAYHVCMEGLSERYDPKTDEYYWYVPFQDTVDTIEVRIAQIVAEAGCSRAVCAKGGGGLFRKHLDPDYKGHRSKKKPLGYNAILLAISDKYEILSVPGLEADDVLGIMHTDPSNKERTVICSNDKDMKTLPGFLYDPTCPDQGVIEISLEEADRNHMAQTLTGDTADGYKGCPGTGMVKAMRMLIDCERGTEWESVVAVFEKAGLTEEYALTQARMARILRHGEVKDDGTPILWCPPSYTSSQAPKNKSKKKASGAGSSSGSTMKKMRCTTPNKMELPKKKAGRKTAK